jgi:hypothetical protein
MIEQALFSILSNDPDISADVPAGRIHPVVLKQNTQVPAITYRRISSKVDRTMNGSLNRTPRFRISSYAETYLEGKSVAEKVIQAMTQASGVIAGTNIEILDVQWISDSDQYNDQLGKYFVNAEFDIFFCAI